MLVQGSWAVPEPITGKFKRSPNIAATKVHENVKEESEREGKWRGQVREIKAREREEKRGSEKKRGEV